MRDMNPFETTPTERARHHELFLNRLQRATVQSVDTERGVCTLEFESTPAARADVGIPLLGMSVATEGQRRKSSWRRYMVSPGDIVIVGFDSNGAPRIIGFDQPSYGILSDIQKEEPFAYTPLKSGEFDDKSSGGAYIRGKASGDLFLAGGLSSLTLSKDRYELTARSGLMRVQALGSTLRFGEVKRTPLPFLPENSARPGIGVPAVSSPAVGVLPPLVEHTVDLRSSLPASPLGQAVAFFGHGNIMDPDVDLLTQGAYGAVGPLGIKRFTINATANARLFWRIYNSVPLADTPIGTPGKISGSVARPFEWGIDQLGNSFINVGLSAVSGYNVYSNNYLSLVSSQLALGGNVYLGAVPTPATPMITPGVGIPLPPALRPEFVAGGPAVCGTPFTVALSSFLTALEAFSGVAAAGTAVTTPADNIAFAKALGGAAAALTAAAAAFAASSPTWLSNNVFIGKSGIAPVVVPPTAAYPL